MGDSWLQTHMRGLSVLQKHLDSLPKDDPSCRDAWCGYWERSQGVYEMHTPTQHDGSDAGGSMDE